MVLLLFVGVREHATLNDLTLSVEFRVSNM
jgi:hypothetical protein